MRIEPKTLNQQYTVDFDDKFLCLDLIGIFGIDEKKRKGLWLYVQEIEGQLTLSFILKLEKSELVTNLGKDQKVHLKVIDFGYTDPIPTIQQGDLRKGTLAVFFTPPENINSPRIFPLEVKKLIKKDGDETD